MDKDYQLVKKPYLPPRLVAVAFKVEDSFNSGFLDLLVPSSDGGGMDSYGTAANSGSFWDSDLSSSGQTEGYESYNDWTW